MVVVLTLALLDGVWRAEESAVAAEAKVGAIDERVAALSFFDRAFDSTSLSWLSLSFASTLCVGSSGALCDAATR